MRFIFGAKDRLYSAFVRSVMLYGGDTLPVKEDVIRPERNDARMVSWIFSVRPEDSTIEEELSTRLKLKSMLEMFTG